MSQTVVPRTLVLAGVDLSSDEMAWVPIAALIANWADNVVVRSSYITDVAVGQDRAEERRGLNGRPHRTFEFTLSGFDRSTSLTIQRMMTRAVRAGSIWPLYPDGARVAGDSGVGTANLNKVFVDTTDRRYYVGGLIMVMRPSRGAAAVDFEIRAIQSLTDSTITVTQNLTMQVRQSTGCRVYPVVEGRVSTQLSGTRQTGSVFTAKFVIFEKRGPSQLPYSFETGVAIEEFPEYAGLPILNVRPQPGNVEETVYADGFYAETDRDEFFVEGLERPRTGQAALYRMRRAEYFKLLRFWDNAGGRLFPFWLPAWYPEFEVTAISADEIEVVPIGELIDWDMMQYVSVWMRDGTLQVEEISGVTSAGGKHVIEINGSLSTVPDVSEILACGAARLARFSSDELVERWLTTNLVETSLEFVELINEGELLL